MTMKPGRIWAALILALAGFAAGINLTEHFYSVRGGAGSFKSYCNLSSTVNCDSVALSRFSELVAGIPLSSFVTGWFLALALVLLIAAMGPIWRRDALRCSLAMSAFSLFMSLVYLAIMAFVIHSYCIVCLAVDAINLAMFGLLLSLLPQMKSPNAKQDRPDPGRWKTFAGMTAACLAVSVVALLGFKKSSINPETERLIMDRFFQAAPVAVESGPDLPSIGAKDAPLTLVEFADFQCPSCKIGSLVAHSLVQKYPGKLRLVFRNFPLNAACNRGAQSAMHPAACDSARIAICANKQGKFQSMYEHFFENQEKLGSADLIAMAGSAGLDTEQLRRCLSDPSTNAALTLDTEEGLRLGIASTPTFFLNGKLAEGAFPLSFWSRIIDEMLSRQPGR